MTKRMRAIRWARCFALASAVLLGAGVVAAQSTLPQPVLTTVYPCAAQVGTSVEVTITGTELGTATRLHFSTPGISTKPGAKPGQFMVTVGKEAACGYHDVRVVTAYGISNPRVFAVSKLPVVAFKPDMKLEAGQATAGRAVKQDHCRVTLDARQGETLQILCEAALLDSRMEPVLTVQDAAGAVLARMHPNEPVNLTPAAGGVLTLDVHDLMFRGDLETFFVLAVSKPGASGLEHPQPLHPAEKMDAIPEKPVAIEDVYTGWFLPRSKARSFTFNAKKGDTRIIEVKCARLGLEGDPAFIVEKMDGDKATFIAEANDRAAIAAKDEFDAGWADPSLRFVAKEDGLYRVKLRNLFPTRVPFELSVRPPGTAFELVALPSEPPPAKKTTTAILAAPLWRGGVATLKVVALRERGFAGPITLSAEGLPPGVTCAGGLIAEGKDAGYVCFVADAKAEPWGGAVRIVGRSGDVTAVARGATQIRANSNTALMATDTRLTDEVPLGVVAADAPMLVEAETATYEATAKGKLSIPLKVTRGPAFAEGFKLTALGIGDAAAPPAATIAAKANSGKLELDIAKLKLPAGEHSVVLQTTAKFPYKPGEDPKAKPKDVVAVVHSKPIIIRVK